MMAPAEDENKKHLGSKNVFLELTSGLREWYPFTLLTFPTGITMKGYNELQSCN